MRACIIPLFFVALSLCAVASDTEETQRCGQSRANVLNRSEFEMMMNEVASGWNQNDAHRAASCFTEDASYSSVPNPKSRKGRLDLYQWFGGAHGRPKPMKMEWHHLIFDPEQQIGVGEYTFKYEVQTHGMVIVKFKNGLISNGREYEKESPKSWTELCGENCF